MEIRWSQVSEQDIADLGTSAGVSEERGELV